MSFWTGRLLCLFIHSWVDVMDEKMKLQLLDDLMKQKKETEIFNKWQLETKELLKDLSNSFGWSILVVEDANSGMISISAMQIVQNPIINKEGMLSIYQTLNSIMNKNTFLSSLKDKEINGRDSIMFIQMLGILDDLTENFDFYEIENIAALNKIIYMVENVCQIALSRGRDGVTLDYLKTVQKLIEKYGLDIEGKKRGFLS